MRKWRRVKDWNDNIRKCAFCVFENTLGLIRCLRVLGGEGAKDLPELKGGVKILPGVENSQLTVTTDPIARFSIKTVRDGSAAIEADKKVLAKIKVLLQDIDYNPQEEMILTKKMVQLSRPVEKPERPKDDSNPRLLNSDSDDDEVDIKKRQERREQERQLAYQDVFLVNLAGTKMVIP